MLKTFLLLCLLPLFVEGADANRSHRDSLSVVKLYVKNQKGAKVLLIGFTKTTTVTTDSAMIKSDNDTLILKGFADEEERRYQLVIGKRFVFHPVISRSTTAQLYFDANDLKDKDGNYKRPQFISSPSSDDWYDVMFGPVKWLVRRNVLRKSLPPTADGQALVAQKEIDSLSGLIESHYLGLIRASKSVGAIETGLALLLYEMNRKPYTGLLDSLAQRFPNSKAINNKIVWYHKYYLSYDDGEKVEPPLANNTMAPDFEFETIDGQKKKLSSYRGYYVLIDFWASWCVPCREESPFLKQAQAKYSNKKFVILQVSLDRAKDIEKWKKAIIDDGVESFVHANKLPDDPLIKEYKVRTIPHNYLLDPTGKIIGSQLRGNDLQAKLGAILK